MSAIDGRKYLYRILDTVGDGSGTINQNVNGSVTPVSFRIKPGIDEKFKLSRLNLVAAATSFDRADRYGDLTLANGISIVLQNSDGVTIDYTDKLKITAWPMWGLLAGSDIPTSSGVGADSFSVRWTFEKGTGRPIELVGSQGDEFVMTINDNLTAFLYQYAAVQGYK